MDLHSGASKDQHRFPRKCWSLCLTDWITLLRLCVELLGRRVDEADERPAV